MKALVSVLASFMFVWSVMCTGAAGHASTGAGDKQSKKKRSKSTDAQAETDPLHALNLMRQGATLLQQQQYSEALLRFEQADKISPGNTTVHNMIGLCHLHMEQHDQALASFNRALDLTPSFTDAQNNRGVTYLALRQYRLAEVDFVAVLSDSTYPHRWRVYYNLGMTYLQRDQLGAAEENFRRAITAPQPVPDAYMRLSELAHIQGNEDEAVDLLEEAHLKFPERTEVTLQLGQLLLELGRSDEARHYLQEVIAKEPGSGRAEEAAQLLRAL
jgi:tetratricopeptide (TPR) repeat protein